MAPTIGGTPRARAAAAELSARLLARRHLLDFARYTMPPRRAADGSIYESGYRANWHHGVICAALDRVVAGDCTRLMIFVGPRRGKSELVSVRLPAYALGRDPRMRVIAASYGADLAHDMSRKAQRVVESDEYSRVFPAVALNSRNIRTVSGSPLRNVDEWETINPLTRKRHSGGYKCAGVGGALTGRGADLLIIDDPFKDRKEAESPTIRDRVWDWYTSVLYTRRSGPKARIVVILTRWHEDDLAGRLLRAAENGVGDQWEVVSLPEIAEEPLHEDDPRKPGEPLWPERFPLDELVRTRAAVGPRDWAALFQQRPAPDEGSVWRRAYLRYFQWSPTRDRVIYDGGEAEVYHLYRFATVDLALGRRDGDHTAIGLWGFDSETKRLFLLHLDRGRYGAPETLTRVRRYTKDWNLANVFVEAVQYQAGLVQIAQADGDPWQEIKPDRDKVARLRACEPWGEQGRILFDATAGYLAGLERELLMFAGVPGEADDQVDVLSYAGRVAMEYCGVRDPSPWQAAAGVARKKREMTL